MARKSRQDPEIFDLCLELHATKGWSYKKIAQHLLKEKGVANEDDPEREVDKATVMRWIRKSSKKIQEEKVYRDDVEWVKANVTLDSLKGFLYALREEGRLIELEDAFKWFDRALALQREASTTNAVYPEKRKRVVHGGGVEVKGIGPKDLDPQREYNQARFEQWLADSKGERSGDESGRWPGNGDRMASPPGYPS